MIKYMLIYYPSDGYCQVEKGFPSREAAFNWIKDRLDAIDYYRIEQYVEED